MRLVAVALIIVACAAPTAALQDFDSGDIAPGESFAFTFTDRNEQGYSYHCHPHPWMEGMVHVGADTDGATTTHTVDIVEGDDSQAWGYSKEHLYIESGDTVVWTNTGALVHTVTAVAGSGGHDQHDAHADHGAEHHDADQDAPGMPLLFAVLALGAVFAVRRAQD